MSQKTTKDRAKRSVANSLLLRVGARPDGVMVDDLTPETLAECEAMLRAGLLRRGVPAERIRVYHTTAKGLAYV